MAFVADVDDVEAFAGHALDLVVDLRHERTHGIHHDGRSLLRCAHNFRRRAVSRQHDRPTVRDLGDVVDEDDAGSLEGGDHRLVVDDLVVAVHGRLEHAHHPGERLDRHLHAGTEAARLR